MNTKLLSMFGATILGSLCGWMGSRVGIMTGYFAGTVGMGLGFYLARRLGRDYLE